MRTPINETRACPDCGNHTARVYRDGKGRPRTWACGSRACGATGVFAGDYMGVLTRPRREETDDDD